MSSGAAASNVDLRFEIRRMVELATPVVLAELGWMAMGIVDTIMVGHLGPSAIGAVSLAGILYYTVAIFGIGLLLGLDTLVSQSFGAGDLIDCNHSLWQGIYISLILTGPLMLGTPLFLPLLRYWKLDPDVLDLAEPFMFALRWSTLPLLLYASVRRYLQSMSLVRPVMFALISANVVNFIGNWIFIYGNLGAPAFGVEGSAWSTAFARVYMFGILAAYVLYRERRLHTGLFTRRAMAFDWGRIRQLLRLGGPAASQILLEIGVFGAATVLAGKLSPVALAAHQIALNSASLTYMVPLGIASAAAISVGQAIGRQDPMAARRSGWIALALGAGFMFFAGICFYLFPYQILGVYTSDRATLDLGAAILLIAAVFQLFDGVQTVAIGALRGAGNTRTPMIVNLVGYWGVGLPAGYLLCFNEHLGIVGLWVGLSAGLIIVAIVLLISWSQAIRSSP